MTSRFVRHSKFRHVFGTPAKRDQCYDNLKVSCDSNDVQLTKANPLFLSVHWDASGGGALAIVPLDRTGKQPNDPPLCSGHAGTVIDTDFSPFNDHLVASASEDGRVGLWSIPECGFVASVSAPTAFLAGHDRKVVRVSFHPTAENVLASASADLTARVWDLERAAVRQTLLGASDAVLDQSWSYSGARLATSSRDKALRVYDVRTGSVPVQEVRAHDGVKGVRVAWLGDSERVLTTGFGRTSERQFAIWDLRRLAQSLRLEALDTSSGLLVPHYDGDTKMLYLAGRGDGNIRLYELVDEEPIVHFLGEYKSPEPQRGVAFLPKRAVNVSDNEVARAFKVHNPSSSNTALIEPISFRVPRKQDVFQADIFPDTPGPQPALSASQFFDEGHTANPILVSLSAGFVPSARRDFSLSSEAMLALSASQSADQLEPADQEEWKRVVDKLKAENEQLRAELAQKSVRLRQLEAQLKLGP